MTPLVVGLDLSLTSTGYAVVTPVFRGTELIKRPQYKGTERLRSIRAALVERITGVAPALVVIESYAHGRMNRAHELGELGGVIRLALDELGVRWTTVTPSTLKRYASGRGNADKGLMLTEAVRRLGYAGSSNDEADALWLACAGHELLGHPVVAMPKSNVDALRVVDMGGNHGA